MTAIITKALFTHNINSELDTIEIHYIKPNCAKKIMFVDSFPNGNWTEIVFDPDDDVTVSSFLNTMVFKNLDVSRKIALLELDRVIEHKDARWSHYIQAMCAMRLLDRTFEPPSINVKCRWQKDLLESLLEKTSKVVIKLCRNPERLARYSRALNDMKLD